MKLCTRLSKIIWSCFIVFSNSPLCVEWPCIRGNTNAVPSDHQIVDVVKKFFLTNYKFRAQGTWAWLNFLKTFEPKVKFSLTKMYFGVWFINYFLVAIIFKEKQNFYSNCFGKICHFKSEVFNIVFNKSTNYRNYKKIWSISIL